MTHADLVAAGRKWLEKPWRNCCAADGGHYSCGVIITELSAAYSNEIPDVIGWDCYGSILLECKASIEDFRADMKKSFRIDPAKGMGSRRYYLAPEGLIPLSAVPYEWGLAEVDARGRIKVAKPCALVKDYDKGAELALLLSTLRRLKVQPEGHISIKAYVHETKNRSSVSIAPEDGENPNEEG